jgi:WhiB family transcriptional regulator, redox-sensing transcriptional regulator
VTSYAEHAQHMWEQRHGPYEDWPVYAACVDNPAPFYSSRHYERNGPARSAREAAAKRICGQCPVRAACLADALDRREPHGVWGGLNEDERAELLAQDAGR